jgi:hypothetical protein
MKIAINRIAAHQDQFAGIPQTEYVVHCPFADCPFTTIYFGVETMRKDSLKMQEGWPPWHRAFFVMLPGHGTILLMQMGPFLIRLFRYNLWGWKPRRWNYRGGTGRKCTVFAIAGFDVNHMAK